MRKVKTAKLIADIVAFTIGGVGSAIWVFAAYHFLKYGGIIFYEQSKLLSFLEFMAAIFGTSYFAYRIVKLTTKNEVNKYIVSKK